MVDEKDDRPVAETYEVRFLRELRETVMVPMAEEIKKLNQRVDASEQVFTTERERLVALIAQIANTIPEKFRPPEEKWLESGWISAALNKWAEYTAKGGFENGGSK